MKILPKKISMLDAICLFELTEYPYHQAVRIIHSYHQQDNLPMYFDDMIEHCRKTTDAHHYCTDENGDPYALQFDEFEPVGFTNGVDAYTYTQHDAAINKQILQCDFDQGKDSVSIGVNKFKSKGTAFFVTDIMGGRVKNSPVNPSNIYFDREEILNFQGSFEENKPTHVTSKSKTQPIQLQRENAFKYWLIVTANLSGTDKATLNRAYQLIGSPTQKAIWDALSKMDPELFSKGKTDFFRDLTLITMETGTGTGRDSIKRQR